MKIIQAWKRNDPSTLCGESITLTVNYSSFDKAEIDELENRMPTPMTVMEIEAPEDEK